MIKKAIQFSKSHQDKMLQEAILTKVKMQVKKMIKIRVRSKINDCEYNPALPINGICFIDRKLSFILNITILQRKFFFFLCRQQKPRKYLEFVA